MRPIIGNRLATALRGVAPAAVLALTAALAPACAQTTAEGLSAPQPRHITQDGLDVLLYPLDRGEDGHKVVTVVRADGLKPFVTEIDTYRLAFGPRVAIGKLSEADATPSAMLQTFTGGAHCCTVVTVVAPRGEGFQAVEIGTFDGGPPDTFPEDVNGDGVADFRFRDDRFLYVFAPYAGSWAPPRFLNVIGGKVTDVTFQPGFRDHLQGFASRAKAACTEPEETDPNGACAAYVAVQARLGAYGAALAEVKPFINRTEDAFLPTGCRIEAPDWNCPEDQQIRFTEFEPALDWFLKQTGYLE